MAFAPSDEEEKAMFRRHTEAVISEGIRRCDPANDPPVLSGGFSSRDYEELCDVAKDAVTSRCYAADEYRAMKCETKLAKDKVNVHKHKLNECKRKRDDAYDALKRKRLAAEGAQDRVFQHPENFAERLAITSDALTTIYTPKDSKGEPLIDWSRSIACFEPPYVIDRQQAADELVAGLERYKLAAALSFEVDDCGQSNRLRILLHDTSRDVQLFVSHGVDVDDSCCTDDDDSDDSDSAPKAPKPPKTFDKFSDVTLILGGVRAMDLSFAKSSMSIHLPSERASIPDRFKDVNPTGWSTPYDTPMLRFMMVLAAAFPYWQYTPYDSFPWGAYKSVVGIVAPKQLENPAKA